MPQTLLRRLLLAFAALTLMAGAAQAQDKAQVQLEGQTFVSLLRLGESDLRLNGVGLRAVAWFKGYAAGLYLGSKTRNAEQAITAPGAKRLQMRMLVDVPAVEFVKAIDHGITRNATATELPQLRERMLAFEQRVQDIGKVRKGDVVDLDWLPGKGMLFSFNGVAKGAPIAGEDFFAAVLKIFIGDKPVDAELKAGLLGGPVS
jgi:Chalcone isomerase-like